MLLTHKHFVAIDMGSNSFHLVIAREQDGSLQILHKEKQPVQLALGLNEKGEMSQESISRGIDCLKDFMQRFSNLSQAQVRPVATHTLRIANNTHVFIDAALEVMPYPIEIISGHEEARLIYSGIAQNQVLSDLNVVIDIGGGSTEVIIGKQTQPIRLSSLRCGCVSYNERFFIDGSLKKENFKGAMAAADKQFATLSKEYFAGNWQLALGSSGSVKAIAAAINETFADNLITLKRLKYLKNELIKAENVKNLTFENIDERRTALIPAGLSILISFFRRLSVDELQYAQGALREGVLYELAKIGQYQDIQQRTINSIAKLYHVDIQHAESVRQTAMELFEHVAEKWHIRQHARLLSFAANVHEIGIHINSKSHHKHGGYIISNSDLPGFSESLQHHLSILITHHRKKLHPVAIKHLPTSMNRSIAYLITLLRLAVLFNLGRIGTQFDFNHVHAEDDKIILSLPQTTKHSRLLIKDLQREQKKLAAIGVELVLH
ncbi:Ppx/GppA family phosphatase [Parashewanella spongiae]|uniref:Ppx/GppA family phosphatase n=1 Tax=Parashewanella spongiae TaxID=342950 RepID=A0A3A6TPU1_9GAMM|nr:Ppx/GppA family phosphatase [Parashewanella spongiae]